MVLSVKIKTNPTDACTYVGEDVWECSILEHSLTDEKQFFIDPRMDLDELLFIMQNVAQYIRSCFDNFDINVDDPIDKYGIRQAINQMLYKGVHILTDPIPCTEGQLRSVVELFRDETQEQWPKYVFKADHDAIDTCVEIAVVEYMPDVDFSDTDIVDNIKLLCEAVSDVERKRIYTVQLISDILASHGHKCVNYAMWNMLEQCW